MEKLPRYVPSPLPPLHNFIALHPSLLNPSTKMQLTLLVWHIYLFVCSQKVGSYYATVFMVSWLVRLFSLLPLCPWREAGDVWWCLSRGLLFESPFLSPLLLSLPSPLAPSVLSFFCWWSILLAFSFSSGKFFHTFLLRVGLFVWLFLSCWEMIVGRLYVQLAALWHWYLPLWLIVFFSVHFFMFFFFLIDKLDELVWW